MRLATALISLGLMISAGALVAGCGDDEPSDGGGSDCEDACEASKECPGSDPNINCEVNCEESEQAAADAGCSVEFDDFVGCVADLDDVCNLGSECEGPATAYLDCVQAPPS